MGNLLGVVAESTEVYKHLPKHNCKPLFAWPVDASLKVSNQELNEAVEKGKVAVRKKECRVHLHTDDEQAEKLVEHFNLVLLDIRGVR